jgi:tetratricopeptide (TPR) repeat protein
VTPEHELDQLLKKARQAAEGGDFAAAGTVLDGAPEGFRGAGSWNYARGGVALRAGQVELALKYLEEAVRLEPEVAEYRSNLGAALLEQAKAGVPGALERALEVLEGALRWGPVFPTTHTNLGLAYLMSKQFTEALDAFDAALRLDATHVPALYNRAATLHAMGRLKPCLAALDATLAVAPGFPPAVESRKNVAAKLGLR